MQKSLLQIAELVAGPPGEDISKPWFIVETFMSIDGPRTRICDGRWETEEQARLALSAKTRLIAAVTAPPEPGLLPPLTVTPTEADSFTAVMYKDDGLWYFTTGYASHKDAVESSVRIKRGGAEYATVIRVPFEKPAQEPETGVWVVAYQVDSWWYLSSERLDKDDASKLARMLGGLQGGYENISVRCIPFPEGYNG